MEMDPSPKSHPILSYVLARLPSLGAKHSSSPSSASPTAAFDIEQPSWPAQPRPTDPSSSSSPSPILTELPHLTNPKVLSEMTRAIVDVAQTRSVLQTLGSRPDHESVDAARVKLAEYEFNLSKKLEDLVLSPRPTDVDTMVWRAHLAEREKQLRDAAEKEKSVHKAVLQLEELHVAYEKLLKEAEQKLVKIYKKAERGGDKVEEEEEEEEGTVGAKWEEVNEEVVGILRQANDEKLGLERVDLSNRKLRLLPEAFGRIQSLKVLNLSNNLLEVIPDSIAGLHHLEELNLSSNLLESLPDTIGLLYNLKILNVSSNKLEALPDSISHCRSLIELDVSFNRLTYLPTNIGYELANLQRLSTQLNKLRSFPTSIGEMKCLRQLDAHFNELRGLPFSIGSLTNLEVLNLSNNFSDLRELPESFGDLISLKELDLSNNQIQALPDSFGRLDNLTKLNLDQNPLVLPPPEVVNGGVEAVKTFMAKRWLDILMEEERKSMLEVQEEAPTGWLTRSTSWLKTYAAGVSESVSGYLSPRSSPRDPFLDQQL